jgi:hypothetical protein
MVTCSLLWPAKVCTIFRVRPASIEHEIAKRRSACLGKGFERLCDRQCGQASKKRRLQMRGASGKITDRSAI